MSGPFDPGKSGVSCENINISANNTQNINDNNHIKNVNVDFLTNNNIKVTGDCSNNKNNNYNSQTVIDNQNKTTNHASESGTGLKSQTENKYILDSYNKIYKAIVENKERNGKYISQLKVAEIVRKTLLIDHVIEIKKINRNQIVISFNDREAANSITNYEIKNLFDSKGFQSFTLHELRLLKT